MTNEKQFQLKTVSGTVVLEETLSKFINGDTVRLTLTYGLGVDFSLCKPYIQSGSSLVDLETYSQGVGKPTLEVLKFLSQEGVVLNYNPTEVYYIVEHTLVIRDDVVVSSGMSLYIPYSLTERGNTFVGM